jgi:hypothetical protein
LQIATRRRVRARGLAGTVALVALFLAVTQPAQATDNITRQHWHDRSPAFNLHTVWSEDWRRPLVSAAGTWATYGGLWFRRGADTSSTNVADSATHIVMPGSIPTAWRDICPQATTLACAYMWWDGSDHIYDADIVFNTVGFTFQENAPDCLLPGVGHIPDTPYDIRTVALHEFGHWGYLRHTPDTGAVMHTYYNGCDPSIVNHDNQSMNTLYYNAGHP